MVAPAMSKKVLPGIVLPLSSDPHLLNMIVSICSYCQVPSRTCLLSKVSQLSQFMQKLVLEKWSRLLAEGKGRRGNVGKATENLVVLSGNIGVVGALGLVRKILRARENGADDRLRVSVFCSRSF